MCFKLLRVMPTNKFSTREVFARCTRVTVFVRACVCVSLCWLYLCSSAVLVYCAEQLAVWASDDKKRFAVGAVLCCVGVSVCLYILWRSEKESLEKDGRRNLAGRTRRLYTLSFAN